MSNQIKTDLDAWLAGAGIDLSKMMPHAKDYLYRLCDSQQDFDQWFESAVARGPCLFVVTDDDAGGQFEAIYGGSDGTAHVAIPGLSEDKLVDWLHDHRAEFWMHPDGYREGMMHFAIFNTNNADMHFKLWWL